MAVAEFLVTVTKLIGAQLTTIGSREDGSIDSPALPEVVVPIVEAPYRALKARAWRSPHSQRRETVQTYLK